jgi:outer membrane lipoprotein-sorting protein
MKKFFALCLIAAVIATTLVGLPQPVRAQGPGLVSSILNKMERNRRDLKSLRAAVQMQKYNAQLHDYEDAFGDVQYIAGQGRNANVRIDWKRPAVEMLAVYEGQYTLYRPRLKQAIRGTTSSIPNKGKGGSTLNFALNMSGAQAKTQFNVEYQGEGILYDGGPHIWLLKLTPKGKATYQYAEVWVDDGGMPVQTRVTENNGDSTLVRLTNIQRNASIPSNNFTIDLPADVKIVKG